MTDDTGLVHALKRIQQLRTELGADQIIAGFDLGHRHITIVVDQGGTRLVQDGESIPVQEA